MHTKFAPYFPSYLYTVRFFFLDVLGTAKTCMHALFFVSSKRVNQLHALFSARQSLAFSNSRDIVISGLTSVNSELYHIVIDGCQNALVQGVTVMAPGDSPNTDGIHVEGSTYVTIMGPDISTGDDCISIGPGTTNLWIEQVTCGPGHGIR